MNKLCCLPCNEPPEIRVNVTCTCCASSHNDSPMHNESESRNEAKSIGRCCRCKKTKHKKKKVTENESALNDVNS